MPAGPARGRADVVLGATGRRLARRHAASDADLLVCGSRGYGPLAAVALGGVSSVLWNEASCPVLVLPRSSDAHRLEMLVGRHHAATLS